MKKRKLIQTRKEFYPFDFRKYLTVRNIIIFLIMVILYLTFPDYMQAIVLMIAFYPISLFTVKTTKYMRGMGIETITSFTIFLGYVYGWKIGMFFGFGIGTYIWAQAGMNQKTLVQCLINALCAFLGNWASGFNMNFFWAYCIAAVIRNIVTFIVFLAVNPDIFNNALHTITDFVWNTLILSHIMNLLYDLVRLIS